MQGYYLDDPNWIESKWHGVASKHPTRYVIFSCIISIKDQEKLVEYLKEKLEIDIRVKREHGVTSFLSSKQSNAKAVEYCFEHYDEILQGFNLKNFSIDLVTMQGGEPVEAY